MGKGVQDRERTAADVFVDAFEGGGPLLLAGDHHGHAGRHLQSMGYAVTRWSRWSGPLGPGSPWPNGGPYPTAALRIPKEKPALDFALDAIAGRLSDTGTLWIYGANDEGIRSVAKRLAPLYDDVRTVSTKRHCRVLRATRAAAATPRGQLEAWRTHGEIKVDGDVRPWVSYPGVFAKGALDTGTEALLKFIDPPPPNSRILDFACGTGVIAATLAQRTPTIRATLTDADALAIESARANMPDAHVCVGDTWEGVPAGPFDWIVSNPPIHAGKAEDHGVLHALIRGAPERLAEGGQLWLVVQRRVVLASTLEARFGHVRLVHQDGRFCVWCAQ